MEKLVQEYLTHNKMYHMEGERGFENLCRLVRALGYRDSMHRMQFQGGCVGDLINFFEDNPGAMEAVVTWIGEQSCDEWKESIQSEAENGECTNEECYYSVRQQN